MLRVITFLVEEHSVAVEVVIVFVMPSTFLVVAEDEVAAFDFEPDPLVVLHDLGEVLKAGVWFAV